MSEKDVSSCTAQRVIIKFLNFEKVVPSEIYIRLKAQFGAECLPSSVVNQLSKSFKEETELVKNKIDCQTPMTFDIQESAHFFKIEVETIQNDVIVSQNIVSQFLFFP